MTVHAIIERLYKSKDLDDCIRKTVREDHRNDFKHELFLLLYDKPQQLLIDLYNSSGLTYYVVRVILNLATQKRNIYHRNYNDSNITYDSEKLTGPCDELPDFTERIQKEEKEIRLINEINFNLDDGGRFPYYRELVKLVDQYGGIRAASRATGIPKSSIAEAVKKVRNHLASI